jgi:hypothetical protein
MIAALGDGKCMNTAKIQMAIFAARIKKLRKLFNHVIFKY